MESKDKDGENKLNNESSTGINPAGPHISKTTLMEEGFVIEAHSSRKAKAICICDMDFDEVLEELGEFGRYQITNYLLVCLPVFFAAANSLSYVFVAGVPSYRCFVPGCDNETNSEFLAPWVQTAIPDATSDHLTYVPEKCTVRRRLDNRTDICPEFHPTLTETCDRWVFETNEHTIVQEWNITCLDNYWKLSMVGTMHFAGILIGAWIFGLLADLFGRKKMFIASILLMSVAGVIQAVSPDYYTFMIFVFINALGTSGVFPLAFIIGVELVGRQKREMSSIVLNYFYAVGEAVVGMLAWLTQDWVTVQALVSAPAGFFVIYYWMIPESVRWLLAKRKTKKASNIIRKAAKVNGVTLSQRLLDSFSVEDLPSAKEASMSVPEQEKDKGIMDMLKEIIKSRKLCLRSLNLFFIWITDAFVFYGLSVNSTSIGGNKYLNFSLVCLIEIPGYTLAWVLMNKVGRRWSLAGSLLLCSITCLAAAFVPSNLQWAEIVLFLIGKMGITSSFGVIYTFTAELYPTAMRSAGVGASSTIARIGAMVAPFAPLLGVYVAPLPMILFGATSLAAGLLALLLPETLGVKLPDTVEDVENL